MRVPAAVAILAFGLAGITGAGAADLRGNSAGARYAVPYDVIGHRAAPLIIYDYEPGVVVRAYWLPPWRHHHYFPFRRDKVTVRAAVRPRPAQTYRRYWSNAWAFSHGLSPAVIRALDMAPPAHELDDFKPVKPHEPLGP